MLKRLPFNINLDTIEILKQLNKSNNAIGELKGVMNLLPNPDVVLSMLTVSESKDSSAIENIITTYEDIYKDMITKKSISKSTKEVSNYKRAIHFGYSELDKNDYISTNSMIHIQELIEPNKGGIRKLPGTVIKNMDTNETVHTPPQNESDIRDLLHNLELFINNNQEYDPLVNLALTHFQFESIHPFYDGNGRTGRILNILYLVLKNKIQHPILYLSKYIIENKNEYYHLLKLCNNDICEIPKFVTYILKGVEKTSRDTISLIMRINDLINLTRNEMKSRLPNIYSDEIVYHIFSYLYTKNEFFRNELDISRPTATKYLKALEKEGFLVSERVGKEVVYKNIQLINIFN
ncbi:MAG: Fic family protein [Tenericutes bacterium]|jgi:Fic family protein|nr:Fic family protein [Mycoplasmatota bacterium]